MSTFKERLTFMVLLVSLTACGLSEYKHIDFADSNPGDQPQVTECQILTFAYQSEIKSIVESQCMNCHFSGLSAAQVLTFGENDSQNAKTFTSLLGGNSEALILKLSGTIPHGGGVQIDKTGASKITTVFQAKNLCSTE